MRIIIVTSVLNRHNTIYRCLKSVADQKIPIQDELIHIVRDGNSTDGTYDICKEFSKRQSTHRLIIKRGSDQGLYDGLNKSLKELKNFDLLMLLHSDDWLDSKYSISYLISSYKKSEADIYYGNVNFFKSQKIVRSWSINNVNLKYWFAGFTPHHLGLAYTEKAFKSAPKYDNSMKISADFKYIADLINKKMKFEPVKKLNINQEVGGVSNYSFFSLKKSFIEDIYVLRSFNIKYAIFWSLIKKFIKIFQIKWRLM